MKQTFDNDLTMFKTVRDFMGNHAAETAGVPAIAGAVTELTALIGQIDTAGLAQATPLTGIAEDKESRCGSSDNF